MKNTGSCPKCGVESVVRSTPAFLDEKVAVTGTKTVSLARYICTACGYVESWVDTKEDLKLIDENY